MLRKTPDTTAEKANEFYKQGKKYHLIRTYRSAIEAYTSSIKLRPSYWAYANRGICYDKSGEGEKALADFNTALRLSAGLEFSDKSDQLATIYYNRAVFYSIRSKKSEALADFSMAIALNPANAKFYRRRAKEYFENSHDPEQYGRAIGDCVRAAELSPSGNHHLYYMLDSTTVTVAKVLSGITALPGNMQIPLLEKLLDPQSWLRKNLPPLSDKKTHKITEALQAAKQLVPVATTPRNLGFFKVEADVYLQKTNPGFDAEDKFDCGL